MIEPDPIDFSVPMRSVERPVAVEFLDGAIGVLDVTDDGRARIVVSDHVDPLIAGFHPDAELGDVVTLLARRASSRAFLLPPGTVVDDFSLGRIATRVGLGLVGVLGIVFSLAAQSEAISTMPQFRLLTFAALAGFILVLLAIAHPRLRGGTNGKAFHPHGGPRIPFSQLLSTRPQIARAETIVERVKNQYGKLVSDVCYRVEYPALFDVAVPQTAEFTRALIAWDDLKDLSASEVSELAARIRITFEQAKQHAEHIGMAHLGDARPQAETALKALRIATSRSGSKAERAAALKKAQAILESLMLYYLPSPGEAEALSGGKIPKALPGRLSAEGQGGE